jgi:hypothetical protein
MAVHTKIYRRNCDVCSIEYDALSKKSKFCGDGCRVANWRKGNKASTPNGTDQNNIAITRRQATIQHLVQQSIPPELQIAFDLLQNEASRWEIAYREERQDRMEVEESLAKQNEKLLELEHAKILDGVERARPDFVDRIINGLGSIPAPLLEQFAPLIGRLGNLIVPSGNSPIQGIDVSLDEESLHLVQWFKSLPEDTQKRMKEFLVELSKQSNEKLITFIDDGNQYLKTGIRLMRPPNADFSMWGK